jgi:hypothetical protein
VPTWVTVLDVKLEEVMADMRKEPDSVTSAAQAGKLADLGGHDTTRHDTTRHAAPPTSE